MSWKTPQPVEKPAPPPIKYLPGRFIFFPASCFVGPDKIDPTNGSSVSATIKRLVSLAPNGERFAAQYKRLNEAVSYCLAGAAILWGIAKAARVDYSIMLYITTAFLVGIAILLERDSRACFVRMVDEYNTFVAQGDRKTER